MERKEFKRLLAIFAVILLLAFYVDMTNGKIDEEGKIYRAAADEDSTILHLRVDMEDVVEGYAYDLELAPAEITEKEATKYLSEAKKAIEADFKEIGRELPIEESYATDMVEAEWRFSPAEYVERDGTVVAEKVLSKGAVIQVEAHLTCGEFEEIYAFPIYVDSSILSEKEKMLIYLEQEIEAQVGENNQSIQLPSEINGIKITWSEEKEYLVLKILFLEVIALVVIVLGEKQKKEQEKKKRKEEMELSYSDVVNQLTVLMQAGMTTRQAWNRIATQYANKQEKQKLDSPIMEAVLRLNQKLKDGEKERIAYEQFAEEVDVVCYRKLMRALIGNLEKGMGDICSFLEEESRKAYEDRILLAKKMGEEASTKMLVPLMMMMVLVMIIVMAPAVISFSL